MINQHTNASLGHIKMGIVDLSPMFELSVSDNWGSGFSVS